MTSRALLSSILLTGVASLGAVPAVAGAATHRFPSSEQLSAGLRVRHLDRRGDVLHLARNQVDVARDGSGRLTLRTADGRSRSVAVPRRGSAKIRLHLSASNGNVALTAGIRTARLSGRFVAEHALIVQAPSALRSLRTEPSSAQIAPALVTNEPRTAATATTAVVVPTPTPTPVPTPTPTPVPTATPTPVPMPTPEPPPGRLFAADSVWNTPVAAGAALDPNSATLSKKLADTVKDGFATGKSSWIQTTDTSTPLYVVPRDQPGVRVTLDAGSWATSLQQALQSVPVPPGAKAAAGNDGHMTIWQPSTDRLWELFKAKKLDDGWHASFGGAMSSVSTSVGHYSDASWPGLSQWYWGASATSLPVIAGTMRISELRSGVIPHALAMNIPYARPKVFSWPAQRTDGTSTDPAAIPEGAHFRLDPTLDLSKLTLPPMTRMMAVAAQRYGMIVRDQTNWAVATFGEDPTPTGTNPYTGATGFYGGRQPNELMKAFPWDRLQLLKMDLRSR